MTRSCVLCKGGNDAADAKRFLSHDRRSRNVISPRPSKTHSESNLSVTVNTNNQVTTYTYDAAGNLHNDGSTTYNYDGENRLAQVNGTSYIYDGDGNRVMKTNGTAGTLYWRAMAGESISETNLSGVPQAEYIFFGGQRIARRDVPSPSTVHYYFSDRLGSTAVVESVTANGATCDQDIDYYPYGGVINDYCGTANQHYRFNGKEFDTESGLHNFGARYQDAPIGRFMTPDWAAKPTTVPYASFGNPQSLNLYSFVNNNPTTTRDPDGHVSWGYGGWQGCEVGEENCQTQHKSGEQQTAQINSENPFPCLCQNQSAPSPQTLDPGCPDANCVTVTAPAASGPNTAMMAGAAVLEVGWESGPPDWVVGVGLLGVGCMQTQCWQPIINYLSKGNIPHDAADADGAKAPGKPGEREGFKDPKTGPKWGRAPNGKKGWVDSKGNVWVPTGQAPGIAHGGPHWDVQMPDGGYQNVRPGQQLQ